MKNPKLFESLHTDFATGKALEYGSELTLLDLFAGMAMGGLMSHEKSLTATAKAAQASGVAEETGLSVMAYRIAKAMLEERENILKGENDA